MQAAAAAAGGGSRRQRAKHAQGGCSETGVSLSGAKQTHTGSRHGCHISLSSPVTPEGSGKGQPHHAGGGGGVEGGSCSCAGDNWEQHEWTHTAIAAFYTKTSTPQQRLLLHGE